jgi:GNAT superfamily N-acetyltransferase
MDGDSLDREMAEPPPIEFRDAEFDTGAGATLLQAMRDEMRELYDGLDMDSDEMPRAGADELGPPAGALIVGWMDGEPVCVGGVKRLDERTCEIKRMYVAPAWRGRGVARALLGALEATARRLEYEIARLDTGPRQQGARGLYESAGYAEIQNFNANPVASFWGEKALN